MILLKHDVLGTGNPGPWVADERPGDNLYTDSTLALDADTGKLKSITSTLRTTAGIGMKSRRLC